MVLLLLAPLGLTAGEDGDCASHSAQLQAVLQRNPRAIVALNALAVCDSKAGDYAAAAEKFALITRLQPGAWQVWSNLGASYLSAKQPEQALEPFRKATQLAPRAQNAWAQMGMAFSQLDRSEDAFRAFDSAQKLAPSDRLIVQAWLDTAAILGNKAADLIERHDYEKARSMLKLIERPLEKSPSWNNLIGYAQFKLNNPEPALTHLQRALALEPENEDYLLDLGEFLGMHRARERAVELFEVAVKRMPLSRRALFGLAVSYILMQRRDEATKRLESLLSSASDFEPAYRALGECYEDAGNWSGLVELGKTLQGVNPKNPLGWYFMGAGQLKLVNEGSDFEAVFKALQEGIALDNGSSRLHFTLAKAYQQQGNDQAAIAELKTTIQLEPRHERAHYVLGLLYKKLNQSELAARELKLHSEIRAVDRKAEYQALLISSHSL